MNQSLGVEKNCIVYSLFCLFIIITIIIIVTSMNIFFVVLLNCFYLNPQDLPFIRFSSPSHWGRQGSGDRAAVWCLVAGC